MEPIFFASTEELRRWFEDHHASSDELWVGFHKKATGRPSVTWNESVDEALCFGWIDGLRKRLDDARYVIRFTPRRPTSIWSAKNVARMAELLARGRVTEPGRAAWEERSERKTGRYSYEQRHEARLDPEQEAALRANARAWEGFCAQPPGYRRTAIYWVASAKRSETRGRRFETLLACSARGERVPPLRRPGD